MAEAKYRAGDNFANALLGIGIGITLVFYAFSALAFYVNLPMLAWPWLVSAIVLTVVGVRSVIIVRRLNKTSS